jgi:uncharacterized protein YdeI (YjbR/CyaY-like superfamily)
MKDRRVPEPLTHHRGRGPRSRVGARSGARASEPARFEAPDAASWRAWLAAHHTEAKGVWLVFAKKHTGRLCIGYDEALDEALCYGWIDSVIKRIDEETYVRKFTPRSNTTNWSRKNLKRVAELIAEGRMTKSGLAVLGAPLEGDPLKGAAASETLGSDSAPSAAGPAQPEAPAFVAEAIAKSPRAAAFWQTLAPSYRRRYLGWITSAKKEEARRARLARVIGFLEESKKSVMV